MKRKKLELDVDYIGGQGSLTEAEEKALSEFFQSNLVSWDDHLGEKYGNIGTPARDKYEERFENFKKGVFIQEGMKQFKLIE